MDGGVQKWSFLGVRTLWMAPMHISLKSNLNLNISHNFVYKHNKSVAFMQAFTRKRLLELRLHVQRENMQNQTTQKVN